MTDQRIGNQFWRKAKNPGRKRAFKNPEVLQDAAYAYFDWVDHNPIEDYKLVQENGQYVNKIVLKKRPYTLTGMCIHIDIHMDTWSAYRQREEFSEVIARIEDIVRTQKFEGAAAGIFSHHIIARDLGLVDKSESQHRVDGLVVKIVKFTDMGEKVGE